MPDYNALEAVLLKDINHIATGLAFATARADSADRDHRFRARNHSMAWRNQEKLSACCQAVTCYFHDLCVMKIGICENTSVNIFSLDYFFEVLFWPNRESIGISRPGKLRRIAPVLYIRNLGCCEADHLIGCGAISIQDIEIVKITACEQSNGICLVKIECIRGKNWGLETICRAVHL